MQSALAVAARLFQLKTLVKYFEVLGIVPPKLNLDSKELEEKFYKASFATHPDKNPDSETAHVLSAELNQAYRTIREKWSRAEYVVKSSGLAIDSKIPSSLAELYFEAQESESLEVLKSLQAKIEGELLDRDCELSKAFEAFDSGKDSRASLERLRELVIEHKYASSILRDLTEKQSK